MIFFFDTETTGLPPRRTDYHDTDKWSECRIVQIAWELYDPNTQSLVKKQVFVVRPDDFIIPDNAAKIHGITTNAAHEHGVPICEMFNALYADLELADTAVAHNMDFDERVLLSELYRYNQSDIINTWTSLSKKCTMKMGTLPKEKWPKLAELYTRLYNTPPDKSITLHRADADVYLCAQCYFKLIL